MLAAATRPDDDGNVPLGARVQALLRAHAPVLDALRGLAILLVILHNCDPDGPRDNWVVRAVELSFDMGWAGVQLFFVLSGFLITGILLDWKGAPGALGAFYARRALRILPLYLVFMALYTLVLAGIAALSPGGRALWPYWLLVSNWTEPFAPLPALAHFWSVAVEEQFYLVWPLVVMAEGPRALRRLTVALVVAAPIARVVMLLSGMPAESLYTFTVARMDAVALGAWVALIVRDEAALSRAVRWTRPALLVCAALVPVLLVASRGFTRLHPLVLTAGHTVLGVGFAALLLASVTGAASGQGAAARLLDAAPLRVLGRYSFGLYVIHRPVHVLVADAVGPRLADVGGWSRLAVLLGYIAVVAALSLALAWVSYHAIEAPALRWKRRFVPHLVRGG